MKYFILAIFFIFLGLFMSNGYEMMGGKISENGLLNEPFFLVPLSLICFALASVFMVLALIVRQQK